MEIKIWNMSDKIYYKFEKCYHIPKSTDGFIKCIAVKEYDYLRGILYFENTIDKTLWLIKWENELRAFYDKYQIQNLHLDYIQLPNPTYKYDSYNNLFREVYEYIK
jgi:hypothetical protein